MKAQDFILFGWLITIAGLLMADEPIAAGLFAIAFAYLWSYDA